jgi:hypothetical protein
MKQLRIRFVLADGGRARFVDREDGAPLYRTVRAVESEAAGLRARDLGTHRPDRSRERRQHTACDRAPALAGRGTKASLRPPGRADCPPRPGVRTSDALGIAAPPDVLKDIEAGLGGEAQLGRVRRDLTKTRDEDLPEHLEPVVRTFYRKRRMATAE